MLFHSCCELTEKFVENAGTFLHLNNLSEFGDLVNSLSFALVAANVGIIIFFSSIVTPIVFKKLEPKQASSYLRAFFPRLYITLFTTSFIAALAAIDETAQSMLSIIAILFVVSFWPLTPAINSATDTGKIIKFKVLHSVSVFILIGQLVAFLFLLFNQ